ncbi:hypothetical protein F5148DRAFT_1371196 [Russula earlei]|uniref:Uncharacterized protein n=1 Tax=Russula earlei TaxID=71964 RepID=A0ACC0TUK0_9AGAM|nr:hypothetical protein F5148DRAFT_1371196 [Russula earlei]
MSAAPPVLPNVEEVAAPELLGGLLNWCLYGVLIVQTYVYSYNFSGDKRPIKFSVYTVFFLETLQITLNGADLYYWFVRGFGNLNHLTSPYLGFFDVPIVGTVVSLTVQFFFMYRIFVLSKRTARWLCAIITLTWIVGNTISDICIASAMVYYLTRKNSSRDREVFRSSHALERIVRLTVETNMITTTVSIVSLLMVALFPHKIWFVCPTSILGKIYSNTLLVSLNNRISIREGLTNSNASPYPVTSFPTATTREEASTDVIIMDMHKSLQDLEIKPLGELESQRRIIIADHS